MHIYEKLPERIEQASFEQIRSLVDLSGFTLEQSQIVMRIVHTLGLPEAARFVRFSPNAIERGLSAIQSQMPLLCDVEMVRQGLTKRMLQIEPKCFLNEPWVSNKAKQSGETRTMCAVEAWHEHIENSIVMIGNAPTALFRLLERLQSGWPKPAVIIGMPVGFIGAKESKQALVTEANKIGVEYITLEGTLGGSAVTSATCNALMRIVRGELY